MESGKRIIDLYKELDNMPEFKLIQRIRTLSNSLEIFKGNHAELRKLLTIHSDMPKALSLFDVKNTHLLYALQRQVLRLLHNFVAAATSLIDHTRILYNDLYKGKEDFPEYATEVKEHFAKKPLASFVVGLRNYCQHYEPPPVLSQMLYKQKPPVFECRLKLKKFDLERFSSWKSPAKKFLAAQQDDIDLLEVVDKYYLLVMDFYSWFGKRQDEIHSEEFARVNAKRKEIVELVIPDIIQGELANPTKDADAPDKSFTAILDTKDWEQLKKYPVNSLQRRKMLITFLEKRMQLNENMKQQINQIYETNTSRDRL